MRRTAGQFVTDDYSCEANYKKVRNKTCGRIIRNSIVNVVEVGQYG